MKKILFAASTLSHIENFHIPYLKEFKDKGYIIHVMGKPNNKTNIPYNDKIISIPFEKSIFSFNNFLNALKIAKIIKTENYDIIILHTTLAAFFARLGIMMSFNKPKVVINTVHGYLFDNKTSFLKRSVMLLAEKFTKCVTHTIIVMNSEDYKIAEKYKLYKNNLYFINGMGVDLSLFPTTTYENKILLREKNNFSKNDFILVYAAEFSNRKNQKFLLHSLKSIISDGYKHIKLLLLGDGALLDELKMYSKELEISENVIFTGYKKNTCIYYQLSDVCVSSSRIEGLPFNIIEAMSVGLPIVASNIKGHNDLVISNENGFLYEYNNTDEFCTCIKNLYENKELYSKMSIKSKSFSQKYSIDNVLLNTVNIINQSKSHI